MYLQCHQTSNCNTPIAVTCMMVQLNTKYRTLTQLKVETEGWDDDKLESKVHNLAHRRKVASLSVFYM